MKSWSWVLLIVSAILIKWVTWYPGWVERNYTNGVYPLISKTQRFLFGWIPFSFGDIFYAFLILVVLYKTFQFFRIVFRKKMNRQYFKAGLQQVIFFFLFMYVSFNLLWGLNYNRVGIASQLGLQVKKYSVAELDSVTVILQSRLNFFADQVSTEQRDSFSRKRRLFREIDAVYSLAASNYPFLAYQPRSLKPSIFSYAGNYLGFQGYYNPFSGEAQVNTTIPIFLEPFVTSHEVAHQLGYAKENEANFVAFLVCRGAGSPATKYSMYFDMYNYAIGELNRRDTARARYLQRQLHPQVKQDVAEFREFYRRHRNAVESAVMWGYDHYLVANNQPGGKQTYNEVVAWLIAYYHKNGAESL